MDINHLVLESLDMFKRIDDLIHSDSSEEELRSAKTLAWRMWMRIEEKMNQYN